MRRMLWLVGGAAIAIVGLHFATCFGMMGSELIGASRHVRAREHKR